MLTGKEDLIQSLIEAYLMEKGTMDFYADAAAKALNTEAGKMFKELSQWEHKHMDFIGFLYQSIQEDKDVIGFERFSAKTEVPVTEAGIPVKVLEAKIEKHEFVDDMGALILALEIEGKAYSLYSRLTRSAVDTNAKVVFQEMMGQEAKHIEYLKKLRIKLGET
jgi:rubrerythrin